MTTKFKRYASYALLVGMSLALSVNAVFAQEAEEAAETGGGSVGLMIAVLGLGVVVILGLGLAMNAQSKSDQTTQQ